MKHLKYTREFFLKFLKEHNITYLKDLSAKHPHLALYYARHRSSIGDLPLLYSKNNFWTKESCASEAKKLLRYGVHEKFYKVWGWGNKLWVLEL